MTILPSIVACTVISFAIGLYVGAFVQRRRDAKEIIEAKNLLNRLLDCLAKLTDNF